MAHPELLRVAVVALWTTDAELVLQRRDPQSIFYPGHLGFFGGKIEPGEDPRATAIRELYEETSLVVGAFALELVKDFVVESRPEDGYQGQSARVHLYDLQKPVVPSQLVVPEVDGTVEVCKQWYLPMRDDLTPVVRKALQYLH